MSGPRLRICVTGPECTGKTTLARRLAHWLGTEAVPEGARRYAERTPRALLASDVGPIAEEHIRLADAAAGDVVVLDTDLLSTVVYARHYYGVVPRWVQRAERARRAGLYLLCDVDVPWVADGIRDRPANREEMFATFRGALRRRHAKTAVIRGDWVRRWDLAREAATALLKEPTH